MQSGFSIDGATGLLRDARQVLSPHFDERPPGMQPELIVVHGISLPPGEFGGPYIEQLFTGCLDAEAHPYFAAIAAMRVSSHLLVRRNGEVVQFVPFGLRAWHAGASSWQGRPSCNDFSIGIEMEGTDDGAYEPAQYQALAGLISALCEAYPTLARERVVGHSDIAPDRKSDPGPAFAWSLLRELLD
ncbi:MAG TPA: 1,6-anhydro-N-acetylmuramyl-L-alanine amidase AmpD [Steroidobacteraceae bacterium]|nr:1,6-anhydro-N-acetylmuramyl-L-alanine amidase AmpD [Steroidobacteraceae bacterium]